MCAGKVSVRADSVRVMENSGADAGAVLKLESLAPRYSGERHGTYFEILKRAIEEQPEVRNIALAGPYGVGKSSVLDKVASEFSERVIKLSLLTLGVEPDRSEAAGDGNPAASTTSNRIQKEILKQLLYQQSPMQTPESRFRRISRFRRGRETCFAVGTGVLALLVLIAAGVDLPAIVAGQPPALTPPKWLRTVSAFMAVVVCVSLLVLALRMLVQGRLGIEKVTAGPATISLPARSSSYFDEYLDEIIYFFETSKGRDIVILEDLDRFNDAGIFESLRSLNGLLNSARQLDGRNVRFIYAVRDSIFEKLGRQDALATGDEARAELVRANRTKFFELIVPVVPFITHKNARDLMYELLIGRGHKVSKDLVDLVARHVADMRLIHNIVNEYEIFNRRLLQVAQPVPQLDPERLFAMVVFKNAHMGEFENIRHGTSCLDRLYNTWRDLVSDCQRRMRAQDAALRARIENQDAAAEHARDLARNLRTRIDALASAPGSGLVSATISVDGSKVDDETLATPAFWRDLLEGDKEITLTAHHTQYYNAQHQTMRLSVEALEALLGTSLDATAWSKRSVQADQATMRRNRVDAGFLRRHTWQQLVAAPQFTYTAPGQETSRTFRRWVEHLLPSRLAVDLVIGGYITSYFALHVSTFYGQLIREDAMTYIMRSIDNGTADADYPLDGQDVEAILRDQGTSVLGEASMYNISILDHLLVHRPEDAAVVVNRLAGQGVDERAFIDHYLSAGGAKDGLVAQLTPLLPHVYTYIVEQAPLDRDERVALLDTAIACRSEEMNYALEEKVRQFLEANYERLDSLTGTTDTQSPVAAVRFIVDAGATLPDVTALSAPACKALADTRSYRLTAQNLQYLAASDDIALDVLAHAPGQVYPYVLDHLEQYLQANADSATTRFTINTPEAFEGVLNASEGWKRKDYDRLVHGANPACTLQHLDAAPPLAWPALAQSRRVPATFANIATYVEWAGQVDAPLTVLLNGVDKITDLDDVAPADRTRLALAIVNADGELTDSHRVKLARSLRPGLLPTDEIEPRSGQLIGRLITAKLIADNQDAFDERLMVDWPTQEYAITKSRKYVDIVGPQTLKITHIAPVMRSSKVDRAVQRAVVNKLSGFNGVPKGAYEAVAECALASRITLNPTEIDMVLKGGGSTDAVLQLLVKAGDGITVDDLRRTLRGLPAPYSLIADKGKQRPTVPDTPTNRTILDRLHKAEIISQIKPDKASTLRVILNQV